MHLLLMVAPLQVKAAGNAWTHAMSRKQPLGACCLPSSSASYSRRACQSCCQRQCKIEECRPPLSALVSCQLSALSPSSPLVEGRGLAAQVDGARGKARQDYRDDQRSSARQAAWKEQVALGKQAQETLRNCKEASYRCTPLNACLPHCCSMLHTWKPWVACSQNSLYTTPVRQHCPCCNEPDVRSET